MSNNIVEWVIWVWHWIMINDTTFACCRFKDGKAYPWPGDVSSFILYPESANQTIYSQALGSVDKGVYTCRVANDSRTVTHATEITVFGNVFSQ